ncbi:MAG: M28 family peptidase [Bacteroidetes bacterium]|nr:M28 family peptidase [Bacteroidota bacterium]
MKELYYLHRIVILCLCFILTLKAQPSPESKFIFRVSQKNLQKNVRELVKLGNRLGGTISGDKSAQYIFKKFKSFGFKPIIISDPKKLVYSNESWQLKVVQPKRLGGLIQHEWLAGYSPSGRKDSAHLTFVGSIEDIDTRRINGGAVLMDRNPSEKMYTEIADAGASCIICYQSDFQNAHSAWAVITSLEETNQNKIPLFNISNNSGRVLLEELEKGTQIVVKFSAKTQIRRMNPKTVIAELKGKTDEYYIVCAHGDSDSGGPGADDNASGVSAVLEIARVLKTMVKNKQLGLPEKSIKFIVWGTEEHSSSSFVKRNMNNLEKIAGVINIDQVGYGKPRRCIYFEGNDIPHNYELLKCMEQTGEDYAGKKGFWRESTTAPYQGGTDTFAFLPENMNNIDKPDIEIPSVTIFVSAWNEPKSMRQTPGWFSKAWKGHPDSVNINYSPYYHSSLDIPALTTDKQPANMVWGVNVAGISLIRLLWQ